MEHLDELDQVDGETCADLLLVADVNVSDRHLAAPTPRPSGRGRGRAAVLAF